MEGDELAYLAINAIENDEQEEPRNQGIHNCSYNYEFRRSSVPRSLGSLVPQTRSSNGYESRMRSLNGRRHYSKKLTRKVMKS